MQVSEGFNLYVNATINDAPAKLMVDTGGVVDIDAETRRREELDGEDVDARHLVLHPRNNLGCQLALRSGVVAQISS